MTAAVVVPPQARILIVDDDPDNRELLEIIFQWEGMLVSTACSGSEALTSVAASRPDLILMDVMMPSMDGYEATAALKAMEDTRDIPVVLVSAHADRTARARGLLAGAADFLTKPIDRAEIVACVRRLLPPHSF